jgi:hypothetical protein
MHTADELRYEIEREKTRRPKTLLKSEPAIDSIFKQPVAPKELHLTEWLDQAEKIFSNHLVRLQAASYRARNIAPTDDETHEIEEATQDWLAAFREGKAKFRGVCARHGLLNRESAKDVSVGERENPIVIDLMDSDIE